jgi:beta-lactamase regulating signal transducer with metallopeptidase domain
MSIFLAGLLSASLSMSAVAALLLLMNRLTENRTRPTIRYYLWLIVLAGFIIPYRPESPVRLQPLQIPLALATAETAELQAGQADIQAHINLPPAQELLRAKKPWLSFSFIHILFAVWISGALVSLAIQLIRHARFGRAVKRWGMAIEDERILSIFSRAKRDLGLSDKAIAIKACAFVASPMLIGLFAPIILLPNREISTDELDYAFRHELTHYRHRDLWVHLLLMLVSAIHWFNPLVYHLIKVVRTECETACDESVIANYGIEKRMEYGETILGFIGTNQSSMPILSTYFFGGSNSMKKRLFAIMDTNRKSRWLAAVCTSAVVAACIIFGDAVTAIAAPINTEAATEIGQPAINNDQKAVLNNLVADLDRQKADLDRQKAAFSNLPTAKTTTESGSFAFTETRSFALLDGGQLKITNVNGGIIISAWDKNEVVLKAEFKSNDYGEHVRLEANSKSDFLELIVKPPEGKSNMAGASCEMELKVPRRIAGNIKSINGDIILNSVTGTYEADTRNGSVVLENASGNFNASTTNGDIILNSVAGTYEAITRNGNVVLENVSGNINTSTTNGSISGSIRNTKDSLEIATRNGSIKVKLLNPNGSLRASTIKDRGSVILQTPGAKILEISENNVSATFGSGNATMKLSSANGSVTVQ